jgi:hypothetical protein
VLNHSQNVLENLFPQAGWDKLNEFPDMYPYFADIYGLRRGYDLISPNDPLQQIAVLMHIMENLCAALRYVEFGTATGPEGSPVSVNDLLGQTINNWQRYIDASFTKEYLPRLNDYCRILEQASDGKLSQFARRTLNELRWTKRLYFLPYYKFESFGPPPFQKQDVMPIYAEIRNLRKYLTMVAAGIEQGNHLGGAQAKAHCDGIENPWEKYNFEVPNPVSRRMDALLNPNKRNNAALVFFSLSVATVLDNVVNNENSWAYSERSADIFRSVNGDGVKPMFGVEKRLNADQIFKDEIRKKEQERQKARGQA